MSLANVVACAPAARMIVLLGDPQQLDQPTQGSHPPGAEQSALSHLLADPAYLRPDRPTIKPEEGLFLEQTWRLHPDVCGFTSDAFYAGRLRSRRGARAAARRRRRRRAGTRRGDRRGHGPALSPGGPRGQRHRLRRGGAGDRGDRLGPRRRRDAVDRPARRRASGHAWTTSSSSPRTTRTSARSSGRARPPACRGSSPGPWTSSRARRRRSASTRSARRRPRTRRAGWSSSTPSTG